MSTRLFIPRDTTALSLGADEVADLFLAQASDSCDVVRNGTRGMLWLEPLVEVDYEGERIAYGPVDVTDVAPLLAQGVLDRPVTESPLYQGPTEQIPFLARQQRLTFARCGVTDPLSIDDYRHHGGFTGLSKALTLDPQEIVDCVTQSGLRGRGGAAFPAGIKWQTVLTASGDRKYIVCNADEGDSGTFADRIIMEGDPFVVIEGMAIAGLAVGAEHGYIYLREEYPNAKLILDEAIALAESAGLLGDSLLGSGKTFHCEVRLAAGAYICGEETSLLESLEGKRGLVRAKPPLPAIEGLFGQPTVVNNVLTLASIPWILDSGAAGYAALGYERSKGTLAFQLAGNIKQGGLVECAFGLSLKELIEDFGNSSFSGRPLKAAQVGGPLGAYLPYSQWHLPMDYEAFAQVDAMIGHGGIVVFDDSADMGEQARFAMEFCKEESCGKCTPCRIGATRGVEVIDRIRNNQDVSNNLTLLGDLCDTMRDGSLCAMGGLTPVPVRSIMKHFGHELVSAGKESSL